MSRVYVEPSGESPALAEAEAVAAAEALGGRAAGAASDVEGLVAVELPDGVSADRLADRLALAHRCLARVDATESAALAASREGARGEAAAFRRLGRPGGTADTGVLAAGRAYKSAGGRIDLEVPRRRFWLARDGTGVDRLLEEVGTIDRAAASRRRMPLLPFRRPVSLAPRPARAAANLARVRPGDRVLDPFLGTGALLAEAGLLGGRLYGIDRDAAMVRGALRNLAYLGVSAEELVVGDAATVGFASATGSFAAVLTDPPYGRSSSTGAESPDRLIARTVPRWGERLSAGGRVVLIVPSGAEALSPPFELRLVVAVRVHRSLTREFRVYERARGA